MSSSHIKFEPHYPRPSRVEGDLERTAIHLTRDTTRPPTSFRGNLHNPLLFREALSALYQIYASDLRFRRRDRSDYLQYLQKQAAKDPSAAKSAAQMQQAEEFLLARLDEEATEATDILDPLLTVHPDEAFVEVFSKDESSYARLSLDWELFSEVEEQEMGTTTVDFSPDLFEALQKIRSYKATQVALGGEGVSFSADEEPLPARELRVPDTWLRGFVQVQAAASLPMTTFQLAPIDLYNVLIYLRQNKAKRGPRGLRYELIPGQAPRLVLEPTEKLFEGQGPVYAGPTAQIIRTWGRRRLFLLQRLLPFVQSITVHTLGSGLPTFYILEMEGMSLTLGLSGWTAQDWSGSVQLDAMLPHASVSKKKLTSLQKTLQKAPALSLEQLLEQTSLNRSETLTALSTLCQRGQVTYDFPRETFRYRAITEEPLDEDRLRYRNEREERAHELLEANQNADTPLIRLTKLNHVLGSGTELHGEVEDRSAYRTYQVSFFLDLDGRLTRAKCSSPWYQRTSGKEGPSEYILALLLLYRQQEAEREEQRRLGQDRDIILAETRTLTRRQHTRETVIQVTLDHKQLRIQWGPREQNPRRQTLLFNHPDEARNAYFARLDQLTSQGYIETQA